MSLGKQVFTSKTYGAQLYKWSPIPNDTTKSRLTNPIPYFCNASAYSQGEDWVSTYSYNLIVVNSVQQRQAYVECNYVQ